MIIYKNYLILFSLAIILIPSAFADTTISIKTKPTYYFGEFLSFTISVPKITESYATFRIIDSNLKASSPIAVEIKNITTTVTAPFPFDSSIFPEGVYTIEIQYSGDEDVAEFSLMDSGKKVMPLGSRQVINGWMDGLISDYDFTKFLISNKVIYISQDAVNFDVEIPMWVKAPTKWWSDGLIEDQDYIDGLQFLVNKGIINAVPDL